MRFVFVLVVVIHAFIHLLGFVKAFDFANVDQLKIPISKLAGVLWLASMILFILVAVFYLLDKNWVWIPAIIAVLLSQILIILSWQDAKVGTVANAIILVFAILSFFHWQFENQVEGEINQIFNEKSSFTSEEITEESIEKLPAPIQRWMKQSGVVGQKPIQRAYFSQVGKMKLKPDQKSWYPAQSEQYVRADDPAFLWKVDMKMASVLNVVGRDLLVNGDAQMMIKLASIIPVVDVKENDKVDESTFQRYLMELPWYPSAALHPSITWVEIDENSAKAIMSYKGVTGEATYYINDQGDVTKIRAMRYKDNDKNAERIECVGEIRAYEVFDGFRIPSKINITWNLEEGPFTWFKVEIKEAKYYY